MYFLENAFPKQLGVATSNFEWWICDMMKGVLGDISCYLDTKVKVKGKKAGTVDSCSIYHFVCLFILVGCST